MKACIMIFVLSIAIATTAFAQLEVSSGFAVNKNNAVGFPVHLAYDFQIKSRWYTKSQIAYKHLRHVNDYVGATLRVSSWEVHQTISYELIKKNKYILKPNTGINYRFYHWRGRMDPPYNTLPQRAWVIGVRNENFVLNSFDAGHSREYHVNNPGFSFQLQNQFRISNKVWLHVTPFIEPDYDRVQNTGGVYIGVISKSSK